MAGGCAGSSGTEKLGMLRMPPLLYGDAASLYSCLALTSPVFCYPTCLTFSLLAVSWVFSSSVTSLPSLEGGVRVIAGAKRDSSFRKQHYRF